MLNKIACNATNSGGIDDDGKVYIWGKQAFGLLGKGHHSDLIKPNPQQVPLIHNSSKFKATQISMGPYHVAIVVNNALSTSPFQELSYAQPFLKQMRKRIQGRGQTIDEWIRLEFTNRQTIDEKSFEQVIISLFDTAAAKAQKFVNNFLSDLHDPVSGRINIIEFVDQLKGARTHNGKVFTWGLHQLDRLGHSFNPNISANGKNPIFGDELFSKDPNIHAVKPGIVNFPSQTAILKVACGNAHTLALSQQGNVYAWGTGECGCLGLGQGVKKSSKPMLVRSSGSNIRLNNAIEIATGGYHSMLLTDQGILYTWGEGQNGRLGTGSVTSENMPKAVSYFRRVVNQTVIAIAAGQAHSAAISNEQELYTWGAGSYGRLGHGEQKDKLEPCVIEQLRQRKIQLVACGAFHTMCKSLNGQVYSWGSGKHGKLGHGPGSEKNKRTPFIITSLRKENIVELEAGPFHSLGVSQKGTLLAWGNCFNGKLGLDLFEDVPLPSRTIKGIGFSIMNSQSSSKFANLDLYNTPFADYNQPIMSLNVPINNDIQCLVQVECGYKNTYFVTNDGQVFVCGDNSFGQLAQPIERKAIQAPTTPRVDNNSSNIAGQNNPHNLSLEDQQMKQKEKFRRDSLDADHLPTGMMKQSPVPIGIPAFSGNIRQRVRSLACGYYHVIVITDQGKPLGWG